MSTETVAGDRRTTGVPILILVNKSEIQDAMPLEEIKQNVNALIQKIENFNDSESAVMPISALNG
jgi:signal recognition particle receptor subunit beta